MLHWMTSVPIFAVLVADELDVAPLATEIFEWQVLVPNITVTLQFPECFLTGILVSKQPDLPKFLAEQFVVRVAKKLGHERVGVDDLSVLRIEDQNSVASRLEKTPIAQFRGSHGFRHVFRGSLCCLRSGKRRERMFEQGSASKASNRGLLDYPWQHLRRRWQTNKLT